MAYVTQYSCQFNNDLNELVTVLLMKKDGPSVAVENYAAVSGNIYVDGDTLDLFSPVLTRSLEFSVNLPIGSSIDNKTFIFNDHKAWRVVATIDGVSVFDGFLLPDESPMPIQDKPLEATFKATDGLKLLANTPLSKIDGTRFDSKHSLLDYIIASLSKIGTGLGLKIYCNIYNNAMSTRAGNQSNDMFQQAYLDYRSFMTSSTDFVDCYTVLSIILKDHFRLYYEGGFWVIKRMAEYQYLPEGNLYFTTYDSSGNIIDSGIDSSDFATINKNSIPRAIDENQNLKASFAYRSIQHFYNYTPWNEIPRNNRFDNGVFVSPPSVTPFKYYTILDWSYAKYNDLSLLPAPSGTTSKTAYRESIFNNYGYEINRSVRLEIDPGQTTELQSESIPVNAQDKIRISASVKFDVNYPLLAHYEALRVYIKTATGDVWTLFDTGDWVLNTPVAGVYATFSGNTLNYTQFSVDTKPIPADGELYFSFIADGANVGATYVYFQDFDVIYYPYVAGGSMQVESDAWTMTQNKKLPDAYKSELQMSDTPKGVLKGCLWYKKPDRSFAQTQTNWWRYGLQGSEQRHYKELVNNGYYNLTYRPFFKIEGTFDGTTFENNNTSFRHPISFSPKYRFDDYTGSRLFVLVSPLRIDLIKGRFDGNFREVYNTAADGTQTGDTTVFKYLFK